MHTVCQWCGTIVSLEALPGAILYQKLCIKFGVAIKFSVSRPIVFCKTYINCFNWSYHIVQEFNKGVYDYIIATDEGAGRRDLDSDEEKDTKEGPAEHEDEECGS